MPRLFAALLLAAATPAAAQGPSALAAPFALPAGTAAAPFGNRVPAALQNYGRASLGVATAGRPTVEGVEAAHALGFRLIVDLRQPDEPGVAEEAARAAALGLERVALPMPAQPGPELDAFLEQLAALLDDTARYPILMNCGTANRAAAAWALYRARGGLPPLHAVEEGRALGLTAREALVRDVLGLPAAD